MAVYTKVYRKKVGNCGSIGTTLVGSGGSSSHAMMGALILTCFPKHAQTPKSGCIMKS